MFSRKYVTDEINSKIRSMKQSDRIEFLQLNTYNNGIHQRLENLIDHTMLSSYLMLIVIILVTVIIGYLPVLLSVLLFVNILISLYFMVTRSNFRKDVQRQNEDFLEEHTK